MIQRLGKKKAEKEAEGKSITVEGINRLVCMARAQNSPLRGTYSMFNILNISERLKQYQMWEFRARNSKVGQLKAGSENEKRIIQ